MNEEMNQINEDQLEQVVGGAYNGPCIQYTIQRGDTLSGIAERFDSTVEILMMVNQGKIRNKNKIFAGDIIWIPYRQ
ncbi:MAG: LysM domain-containing protein [Clostridia bacterium]